VVADEPGGTCGGGGAGHTTGVAVAVAVAGPSRARAARPPARDQILGGGGASAAAVGRRSGGPGDEKDRSDRSEMAQVARPVLLSRLQPGQGGEDGRGRPWMLHRSPASRRQGGPHPGRLTAYSFAFLDSLPIQISYPYGGVTVTTCRC
jgi:hypothetical protein